MRALRLLVVVWALRAALGAAATGVGLSSIGGGIDRFPGPPLEDVEVPTGAGTVVVGYVLVWLFDAVVAAVITLGGLVLSLCGVGVVGSSLALIACVLLRRGRVFCLCVSGMHLLLPPVGTIAGAVGLVVLLREDVQALFRRPSTA